MKFTLLFIFLTPCISIFSQPTIEWQKTYGGNSWDQAYSVRQTSDGGYIVAGASASTTGDVFGNQGGHDFWILKLSPTGSIQWKKLLGGTVDDKPFSVHQTIDGGYIVTGYSSSNNLDVSGNHGGYSDGWVVKLSSTGALEWQRAYGGSDFDLLLDATPTTDGGFALCGSSRSIDGDLTENKGLSDLWVIKINAFGEIEWQKTYGGSMDDEANAIRQTSDGGFVVAGEVMSPDGDVEGLHGNVDFWVLKLDSVGTLEWQKPLGGDYADFASDVLPLEDGSYVVTGYVGSVNSGQVMGNEDKGLLDYWLVKLSSSGELIWQTTAGGNDPDYARAIIPAADGGFLVIGSTGSEDGDVVNINGLNECWLVKFSETGDLVWQKTYGGSMPDEGFDIASTNDGGFIIAGDSWSTDGDLTGSLNRGKSDYCIIKLSPEVMSAAVEPVTDKLVVSPNPATDFITLGIEKSADITIFDIKGREMIHTALPAGARLYTGNLPNGSYLLRAQIGGGIQETGLVVVGH